MKLNDGIIMNKRHHSKEEYRQARRNLLIVLAALAVAMMASALMSCETIKYVPVETVHTEHHWHTDSIIERDSTHTEKQTTVMQLDSAAMSEYGIRLSAAERAWLVRTSELERIVRELSMKAERKDTVRDTLTVTVPLPAELSRWQRFCCDYGKLMIGATVVMLIVLIFIIVRRIRSPT